MRRVLLKLSQESALFGNKVPPKLMIPYQLKYVYIYTVHKIHYNYIVNMNIHTQNPPCRSHDMGAMHQDTSEDREVVMEKLREIFEVIKDFVILNALKRIFERSKSHFGPRTIW